MGEAALSPMAVYNARPTVRLDGREDPKASDLPLAMGVAEQGGGRSALEVRVSNVASDEAGGADLAFEDDAALRLGARIAIYGGDVNAPQEIFEGTITGLEGHFDDGPPELVVLAEDAFQRARMARRTKLHEDATIASLAEDL